MTEPGGGGSSGRSRNDAGREPPAQGERALQADLGKWEAPGEQWPGLSRYTGLSAVTSVRRAPGHLRRGPRLRTPKPARPGELFGSHRGPCGGDRGLPPPVTALRRPWFRTRPCPPSSSTAGSCPPRAGEERPGLGQGGGLPGSELRPGWCGGPAGTLGRNRWCGCSPAHSLPQRGFPSAAGPSLFLSSRDSPVPARPGVTE